MAISMHRDEGPHEFHDAEWPGTREKPVNTREHTPEREGQYERATASLECVHRHHEGDGEYAIDCDARC
jgi:hypothetical protein